MELDELKQMWQQPDSKKIKNTDIMELIQQKSYGPLAALKKVYRKQIILMSLLPFFLLFTNNSGIYNVLTSIMFWSYVAFCIGVIVFAQYNYRIVSNMENMDRMVKENLEEQIHTLEKRAGWEITGLRLMLLYFVLLAEIVPYFQHYRMLDKWHSLPPLTRFGAYAAFLILQYFLNKKIRERKVGRHLTYLKQLVKEME